MYIKRSLSFLFLSLLFLHCRYPIQSAQPSINELEKAAQELVENDGNSQGAFYDVAIRYGHQGAEVLRRYSSHSNPVIRETMILAFRHIEYPCNEAHELMKRALQDENSRVRSAAIYYLGSMKCRMFKDDLEKLLQIEQTEKVVINAINVLGGIGDSFSSNILKSIQENPSKPIEVRIAAAGSLAQIGSPYNSQLLKESLKNPDLVAPTLLAYAQTKELREIQKIQTFLSGDFMIRLLANIAIHSIELNSRPEQSLKIHYLFDLLNDPESEIRKWAVDRSIDDYKDEKVVDQLKTIAYNPNHPGRVEVIGKLSEKKIISDEELKILMEINEGR